MDLTVRARGMDVSVWQGNIDWQRVADSGIKFAIIRATFGNVVDNRFRENVEGAQRAGIGCGAYHYSTARSVTEARQEAQFFLQTIDGYKFAYPVAVDVESITQSELGEQEVTEIIDTFCSTVEDAGYYVAVYCDLFWIDKLIESFIFEKYDLWLAEWTSTPTYSGTIGLWQYTGDGAVDGVGSNVDLDIAYKDYPSIIRANGLNGFLPEEETESDYFVYTVKSGDTLWTIAQRFGTSYDEIARLNNLSSPYLLQIGQTLKIPSSDNYDDDAVRYTVQSGDSLWEIGKRFSVDYRILARVNRIANPEDLAVGQIILIPKDSTPSMPSETPNQTQFKTGEHVAIKPSATEYYAGRRIPDWVKNDYTYYITATAYNGQPVMLGGKRSVLLGKRQNNLTGLVEPGINTWVNEDILQRVE